MTVKTKVYPENIHGAIQGHMHSVTFTREGSPQVNRGTALNNGSQFDTVDGSLAMILLQQARSYRTATVVIEGSTLPESLQTLLIDKYEVESTFTSITFA